MPGRANLCQRRKTRPAGLRLATGLGIVLLVFTGAVFATRCKTPFGVHRLALARQIDTSAFYYTDIEEFAQAENWITSHLERSNNASADLVKRVTN